jgi:serine/threonine protein phosphatase PrpC
MLRVAEHAERTDTGLQRRANEDAYHARAPLFAVADGMGGAQAGEVASGTAVDALAAGLPDGGGTVEQRLALVVQLANERIHALSVADEDRAGMGTTLTAAYVGSDEVTLVHVGDSRCYRLRDGAIERLTTDHSLVEELVRQGRLSPQEAAEHPQRSIITRALGPEAVVEPDSLTVPARGGDVYLLCSDGLTSMIAEPEIAEALAVAPTLRDAAADLVARANAAGGRDNITVVLFRLEDAGGGPEAVDATRVGAPALRREDVERALAQTPPPAPPSTTPAAAPRRDPLPPRAGDAPRRRRRMPKPGLGTALIVALLVTVLAGGYLASQAVYFVGPGRDGFVTLYRGVPVELPGGIDLYQEVYVSGVSDLQLTSQQRSTIAEQSLRSRDDADDYVRQLERGSVGT